MKALANVYLLSTKDIPIVGSLVLSKHKELHFLTKNDGEAYSKTVTTQHLYITLPQSDLEISRIIEGGYAINTSNLNNTHNNIIYFDTEISVLNAKKFKSWENIIATTDESLVIESPINIREIPTQYIEPDKNFPSIPQSFIEHFIYEYNQGRIVKQIEVELIETLSKPLHEFNDGKPLSLINKLKLNQQNEIYIVIPEEKLYTFTKNDLSKQLSSFCKYFGLYRGCQIMDVDIRNWIDNNLNNYPI